MGQIFERNEMFTWIPRRVVEGLEKSKKNYMDRIYMMKHHANVLPIEEFRFSKIPNVSAPVFFQMLFQKTHNDSQKKMIMEALMWMESKDSFKESDQAK